MGGDLLRRWRHHVGHPLWYGRVGGVRRLLVWRVGHPLWCGRVDRGRRLLIGVRGGPRAGGGSEDITQTLERCVAGVSRHDKGGGARRGGKRESVGDGIGGTAFCFVLERVTWYLQAESASGMK